DRIRVATASPRRPHLRGDRIRVATASARRPHLRGDRISLGETAMSLSRLSSGSDKVAMPVPILVLANEPGSPLGGFRGVDSLLPDAHRARLLRIVFVVIAAHGGAQFCRSGACVCALVGATTRSAPRWTACASAHCASLHAQGGHSWINARPPGQARRSA